MDSIRYAASSNVPRAEDEMYHAAVRLALVYRSAYNLSPDEWQRIGSVLLIGVHEIKVRAKTMLERIESEQQ